MKFVMLAAVAVVVATSTPAFAEAGTASSSIAGDAVVVEQLAALGMYRGSGDVPQAVETFHKALGVTRTSTWTPADAWYASHWVPDIPARPGEPNRIEIDLTRQVLYLISDGDLVAVIPVSSGSGNTYRSGGSVRVAHTPEGEFTTVRHIAGARYSSLGFLWQPWYFYGGYAIHGSRSVPVYPASHGCVRVPMDDSNWLEGRLVLGMPVHVWSGSGRLAVRRHVLKFPMW